MAESKPNNRQDEGSNMKRYLRNKRDGFIYEWHPVLAANALCEEITEEQAFPERFIPKQPAEVVTEEPAKPKRKALDLSTAGIPEPPPYTAPELAAEASRRLPK
jgi:hypothetical protein